MGLSANDVVLITGASAGFGEACARRFAADGCKLILCGRRKERLEALAEKLDAPTLILSFDISKRAECEAAIASIPDAFQNIALLINNAGIGLGLEPAHEASLDEWETMIDTNIKGLSYLTRMVSPGMVERKRGHIINLSSTASKYPYPGGNVYGATKAFVSQFSLNLRADLIGTRIRVTSIEPGMAETEFSINRFRGDKQAADDVYRGMQPLTADDIAESIHWAASQPEHVNINRIEVMPTAQAFGTFAVDRTAKRGEEGK